MKKNIFILILFSLLIGSLVFAWSPEGYVTGKTEGIKIRKLKTEAVAPEFRFISPRVGATLKEKIKIKGRVKGALSVEFYLKLPQAAIPVYLGNGVLSKKDTWEYLWDTSLNPNGEYQLFSKITNSYGEYTSEKINVFVKNEVERNLNQEKKLEKSIKEARTALEKEEEKIDKKRKETEQKIIKETETLQGETQKLIEKKRLEEIKPDINKKVEEAKKGVKEAVGELVQELKKEKKTEINLEKKVKEKKEVEKKIENAKKELKQIQDVKRKAHQAGLKAQEEEAKVLEKINQEEIEAQKQKKEEIEEKLKTLNKEHKGAKEKKEKIKKEILEKITGPGKVVEKAVKEEKKPAVLKTKQETEKKVKSHLEELETMVSESEKVKSEKLRTLIKDSDQDGISDSEEIKLGTDPFNPDSDQDGFLDGTEYVEGYDPLKPSPADKIIYGDPKKVKPTKDDIYKVERVGVTVLPTGQIGIEIRGKGLPNSFVTVYIYSYAIVMTTKTDGDGNWTVVLDKPLADGRHEVYTTVTNNHGEITARSDAFVFVKSGAKVAAITIPDVLSKKIISPVEALHRSFLILAIAIIVLAIGIAISIIGILTQKRKEKFRQ